MKRKNFPSRKRRRREVALANLEKKPIDPRVKQEIETLRKRLTLEV